MVVLPAAPAVGLVASVSEVSGVVGREGWALKGGRRREVRLGDGGNGVGGRL